MSQDENANTGESPTPSPSEITTCIFDLFFDIPHPCASALCERAKIIEPPGCVHPDISELYDPSNISRIPKFAFPDYNETTDSVAPRMESEVTSAILNKFDICCFSTRPKHHTFSLLLDSGTRVHAHVLRYLPVHSSVQTRYDVGRRSERAMVLITRCTGGISFYASLLKSLVAIGMETMTLPPDYVKNHDLVKAFLHSIYKKHLLLKKKYLEKRVKRGFQKVLGDEDTKITIHGAEFHFLLPPSLMKKDEGRIACCRDTIESIKKQDYLSFSLPNPLQPGYNKNDFSYECENIQSPSLPLLRCLGPAKSIRILSALICEHRVIFVSKHIEILSACVNACTAMLAQGLLIWRHVQIPVLPPHLLQYLTTEAPYIVGVLEKYCESIEFLPGLKDILYIDLDKGHLKTLHMPDAQKKIPDLLLKRKKKKNNSAVEELVSDFKEVLLKEREDWQFTETLEEKKEDSHQVKVVQPKKKNLMEKFGLSRMKSNFNLAQGTTTSAEPEQENGMLNDADADKSTYRYRMYILNSNERGEEQVRATLVCFFLELYGDMGMYLSVDDQNAFCLDAKKFLARKRQMGAKEDTPIYILLQRLTRSIMFERFTQGRILEIEKSPNHSPLMVCHTPLFQLCQQHMNRHKSRFATPNIRKVVFTTISACLERRFIDKREEAKERAMALTAEKTFEGDEVQALTTLINVCKECNQSFTQVLQVIWLRISDDNPTSWKHPLLGLHLLRNFLLHGPITTISAALGEFERIRALMDYAGKDEDCKLVQVAARQVYALLRNLCRLFLRRRKVVSLKIENSSSSDVSDDVRWSSYLIRRLPQTVLFAQLHDLVRPSDDAIPRKITKVKDNFTAIQPAIAVKDYRRDSADSSRTQVSYRAQQRRGSLASHHTNATYKDTSRRNSVGVGSQRRGSMVSVGHQSTYTHSGPRHPSQRNDPQGQRQISHPQIRNTPSVAGSHMYKPSNSYKPNNMSRESQERQSKSYTHINGSSRQQNNAMSVTMTTNPPGHNPSNNYRPNNMSKESQDGQSKSYTHINGSSRQQNNTLNMSMTTNPSGHPNNALSMSMTTNVATKENLMSHKGDEQIQINSIHATYRSSHGILKGFEEVKL